jgi:hypothetical protein
MKPDEERFFQKTWIPVLKIEGKCSRLRAKPAHFVSHLPLLKIRFLHPSNAISRWSYARMGQESRDDTIGTTVSVEDAVACSGKQKEEAMAQGSHRQFRIGRGRDGIVFTGEYQGRN